MQIAAKHISAKKRIGTMKDGSPIIELSTRGGLFLVVTQKDGKPTTLAVAPHPAVCRYQVEKNHPDATLTELSKSEQIPEESILSILPKYDAIRDFLNEKLGAIRDFLNEKLGE